MCKKVLVIGENSYIGKSFYDYAKNKFDIKLISSRNGAWRETDFTGFDSVLHCAGIAHVKETRKNKPLYHEINCELTADIARKAKAEGVKQFIFMSSMSVYGAETGIITKETIPKPKTMYGKSKLEAEKRLNEIGDEAFKVAVLRPPMVYGENCPGNYQRLIKLIRKTPVFPKVSSVRSMVSIENLCGFIGRAVDRELEGLYFPQDEEYVNVSELAVKVKPGIRLSGVLGVVVKVLPFKTFRKVFGSLVYEKDENCI
jgi:UDP-glucose 4-epimerase